MYQLGKPTALDRRRFLTGAIVSSLARPRSSARAQDAEPIPVPIRIQTPDLPFVDALQQELALFAQENDADRLLLSIVPAEPAADSLLSDLRLGEGRFSGAVVPAWSIPDLVRDRFIEPAPPPPVRLPPAIAQLRSFGGEWVATDFDHDCTLLFTRADLLDAAGIELPETWSDLAEAARFGAIRVAAPQTFAQQVTSHFSAMAASVPGSDPFWFDADSMTPVIDSEAHRRALEIWQTLSSSTPESARTGSTGDLWQCLLDGSAEVLIARADFLPFALERGFDLNRLYVAPLPGEPSFDGTIQRVGNAAGANWGGVTIDGLDRTGEVSRFLSSLSLPASQTRFSVNPQNGITPAPNDANPDVGPFEAAGWPATPTATWLGAIAETLWNPHQLPQLRIAETQRYLGTYESRIVSFLDGAIASPDEALTAAADDWRTITEAIGVETQQDLYRQSLMPAPPQ